MQVITMNDVLTFTLVIISVIELCISVYELKNDIKK